MTPIGRFAAALVALAGAAGDPARRVVPYAAVAPVALMAAHPAELRRFVGAVLVSLSSLWKTGEKVVAIVVPFVAGGLSILVISTMVTISAWESSGSSSGTGTPPPANNPLLPAWYDMIWGGLAGIGILLIPLSGLWLLWRLRGRVAR